MASGYWAPLAIGTGDGPTLTGASAATAIPVSAKITFPPNAIQAGTCLRITAQGRISCVVTSPGTARFDVRLGSTVVYDSGPLSLNVIAKTTLPWWFDGLLVCRVAGSAGNFFGFGKWTSEAYINTAVATTGPAPGSVISSVSGGPETAPAVGANVDLTASNTFDFFYTQTVSTAGTSFTIHNFLLESGSVALM